MTILTPFKLTEHDRECLDILARETGLRTRAAVLRQAIRALAKIQGVQLPAEKLSGKAKKIAK
jgi:hypothetical protein